MTRAFILANLLLTQDAVIVSGRLPEPEIAAAITEGTQSKGRMFGHVVTGTIGGFVVVVRGPYDRVASAAAQAAAKYLPFTLADVNPNWTEPFAEVAANPVAPRNYGGQWSLTAPATHIVIKANPSGADPPVVVQPGPTMKVPAEWSNSFGAKFAGQGIIGYFRLADLPTGEFQIIVITDAGEWTYTVKAEDRSKIR